MKNYELKDHLGNVRLTFNDVKKSGHWFNPVNMTCSVPATANDFVLNIKSVSNYYPFGMLQPGYSYSSESHRFGFNGMEKDDEIKGTGNSLDFGARMYDSRLGIFQSLDPLSDNYPSMSPFIGFSDNPILFIDPNGMEIQGYDEESENELKNDLDEVTKPDVFIWKQNYFLGPLGKFLGLKTSRTLEINKEKVESLKNENKLNKAQLEIIDGFSEIIESNKTIYAIYGKTLDKEYHIDFSTTGEKNILHGMQIVYSSLFMYDETKKNEFKAYVISDKNLENFSNIGKGVYSADNGLKTLPYRPGRTVHEFLDEGLPWIRTGVGMNKNIPKIKQVYFHNNALLQRIPVSPLRNGLDH